MVRRKDERVNGSPSKNQQAYIYNLHRKVKRHMQGSTCLFLLAKCLIVP